MPITVTVALELRSLEEIAEIVGPRWKEVELLAFALTRKGAKLARTIAFGQMVSAYVGCGWDDCYFVPGADEAGSVKRRWSANDTRRLFGNSREGT